MYARAGSAAIIGVDAQPVMVEAHRSKGLPGMALIGLARGAARESLVRVRSAIIAAGAQLGSHRLVVNLLPAEVPKEGSALDLPLAVSLLASGGIVPMESLTGRRFFGELSLGGALEPVRGAVLLADLARRELDREIVVPYANAQEAATIPGVRVIGARDLSEVIAHLSGASTLEPFEHCPPAEHASAVEAGCLSDVRGQERPKRALEVAAAGGHNLLMLGPPGSGKTMLARRLPGILPELSSDERIEVTRIHSAAGLLSDRSLIGSRPFRAPHHTASEAALVGGGSVPRPGEITLAHRGVLFLDELPEFSRKALESLREPLEEGAIHVARASMSLCFPARVLLVASMNPCPCGRFRGDAPGARAARSMTADSGAAPSRLGPAPCLCTFDQVLRYRSRISGPLLDRIDMHVLVDAVPYRDYAKSGSGDTSRVIRQRVQVARRRQTERFGAARTNSSMSQPELRRFVPLDDASMRLIEEATDEYGLSTRAIGRILKVARTLADLEGAEGVTASHVAEAVGFRVLDTGPARVGSMSG